VKSALADNDVFNGGTTAKFLLMNGVLLVDFLAMFFRQVVQGILVDHSRSVVLQKNRKRVAQFDYEM
jgi:hypothetical protein